MNYFLFTLYAIFICIYLLRQYNCFTKIFQVVRITYWYGCTVIFQSNLNTITFFSLFFKLIFFYSYRCWSYVGRTGREQQLSLDSGCWYLGTVAHEIGLFQLSFAALEQSYFFSLSASRLPYQESLCIKQNLDCDFQKCRYVNSIISNLK